MRNIIVKLETISKNIDDNITKYNKIYFKTK